MGHPCDLRNNLAKNVYFFVDRDFDDLRGRTSTPSVFMTDQYSVENYLVNSGVLTELLKNDFHCHAYPNVRKRVVELFETAYASYLAVTREVNFRLFISRRIPIHLGKNLPTKIGHLASVELERAQPSPKTISELVVMEREPTEEEVQALEAEFNELEEKSRFRGKFALMFFLKWLALLAEARRLADARVFEGLERDVRVRLETITVEMLASKSAPPPQLRDFLAAIREQAAA